MAQQAVSLSVLSDNVDGIGIGCQDTLCWENNNTTFSGVIDSVRLYDYALTQPQINALATASTDTGAAPITSITSPASNTLISGSVTITATAADTDSSISEVAFYAGNTLLGTATSSPYTYTWSNPTPGDYLLTTWAYSNGLCTMSTPVSVMVLGPPLSPWSTADIGPVGLTGNAGESTDGTWFEVTGSGAGVGGGSNGPGMRDPNDAFRFVYQKVSGNCTIVAYVDNFPYDGTDFWQVAGVDMRASLNANAAHAFIGTDRWQDTEESDTRATAGGSTTETTTPYLVSFWMKVVRNGSNFSCYYSLDGVDWTQSGSTVSIAMTDPIYVGMAVSSTDTSTLVTATYDNVTVTSGQVATPAFSPAPGTYLSVQNVSISTTTGGATIRYTTNGTTPSSTVGTVYSSAVAISATATLQAIAYESGYSNSTVASGVYTINIPANFFTALYSGSSNYNDTLGYEFVPTQNLGVTALGRAVSGSMNQNHTINIWQVSNQSLVASATVTPSSPTDALGYKYTTLGTTVNLTSGTTYRITSDERMGGDECMMNNNIGDNTGVATVTQSVWGETLGAYPTYGDGDPGNGFVPPTFYTGSGGQCATPTFIAAPGTYGVAQSVTIACATSGTTIRYTTDGSTPTETHGTVYSNAVSISSTTTLQAIAYETGYLDSPIASGVYTITAGWAFTNYFTASYNAATLDCTGSWGYQFTPTQNISVTALGRSVCGGMNQNHAIYIWQVSNQSLVTSATVTPGSPSDALGYKYTTLGTPVPLTGGVTYRICSDERTGGDACMNDGNVSGHLGIATISQAVFAAGPGCFPADINGGTDTGFGVPAFYVGSGGQCATPTFSPIAGTYGAAQSVTISCTTSGTTIRYTTDGSTPTETHGTVYSSPVSISSTTALQAIAYETGYSDSPVASGTYTITNGWAFTNFFNALYTGSSSSTGSLGYEFTPTQNITVTALGRAVSGTMNNSHNLYIWQVSNQSLVTSATVTPSSPTDTLGYKYVVLGTAVTLTGGTTYRIASDETSGGDAYMTQANASSHSGVATISQAVYSWTQGAYPNGLAGGTDTAYVPPTFYISGPCAAPTFNPAAGTYSSAQMVTISTSTSGAAINYATNGTTPSSTVGTVYNTPVSITANTTLQAIAYAAGYTNSSVASGNYTIQCATPTFNPVAGTFTTSTSVTISTTTSGASIRYTTNGTTPSSTVGTVYSSAVSLNATSTLQAIAYETGLTSSAVASGVYTIQCAAPAFSPAAGTYTSATVTITSATSGASIRYTTNGTTPSSTVGTVYSSPVAISATETLQAIAYKTGLSNSAITSGAYTIYIGTTTAGGTNTAITANEMRGTRFQAGSAMTINHINLDIGTSVSGNIQCAIYSDSSSKPGSLLKGTNALNNPGTGWQTFTLTSSQALTSGTYYWLLFWSAANYSVQNTTSSGSSWYRSLTYGSWPSSAGSGTTETRTWSIYGY